MTVQRPDLEPHTQPIPRVVSGERRRAAIALGVLAAAAIVLVLIMVQLLGGSSDPSPSTAPVALPSGPAVTVTGGASSQQSSAPTGSGAPTTPTPHRTPSSGPRRGPVSCPTSAPCALSDDVGDVLGALNAYRAANGQQPVTGSVTPGARTCALTQASSCPNGFFWEPVGRSGKQVVDKIVTNGEGAKLLAPGLKHVQIGWAYLPSSHSFWCALVANSG